MEFIRAQVKKWFAAIRQPRGVIGVCPVTGAKFVWGEDPMSGVIERASRAIMVRQWFAQQYPDLPQFPLSYAERETPKSGFGLGYFLALYARSIAARGFHVEGYPSFERYVCGCMAMEHFRTWASSAAPGLLAAFPAEPLADLDPSGYVNVPGRAPS